MRSKRLGLSVVIVSVAMLLLFCMIYLIPGDPASVALGPRATEAMKEALRIRMGLDQPIWVQFWNFYTAAWRGDLGKRSCRNARHRRGDRTVALHAGADRGRHQLVGGPGHSRSAAGRQ
jgi:ABC-type dipeptide/oligopeptide/nickel transport system permease component